MLMDDNSYTRLKIDKEFKSLIRPLSEAEYLQLEANLISDGCRDPIITWKGYIIDGHNRYEICRKNRIQFKTQELHFDSREEVIAWICANQLGRRNISEETRKYLIGVQYESEKIVNQKKNANGLNQHSQPPELLPTEDEEAYRKALAMQTNGKHTTAGRIAADNHVSHGTVQKYGAYSRALDTIKEKCPELFPKLLSGRYKISHQNLIDLSKLSATEIRKVVRKFDGSAQFTPYKSTRSELQKATARKSSPQQHSSPAPSVKDIPKYDPDAEVTSLTLTIPTWISSMNRVENVTHFGSISDTARKKTIEALKNLYGKALELLAIMEDAKWKT